MNYKAELRGFALDRATRLAEIAKELPACIFAEADKIVEYLYIAEKDIKGLLEAALPLIVQSGDIDKISGLILELQQIEAEVKAGIKAPVSEPVTPEVVA